MPWKPSDAKKFTKLATTKNLQETWSNVSNNSLKKHGDEERAIRTANAVVRQRVKQKERGQK